MVRAARSLEVLRRQLNDAYPGRSTASDGGLGDDRHAAVRSDHNPDASGVYHARDYTDDDDAGADMQAIADAIRFSRDRRVKYLIHAGRICSSYATTSRPAWAWGPYSGLNAHTRHLHVSVLSGAVGDDEALWQISRPPAVPPKSTAPPTNTSEELPMIVVKIGSSRYRLLHNGRYVGVSEVFGLAAAAKGVPLVGGTEADDEALAAAFGGE